MNTELGQHMNTVARHLLGEPNKELSTKKKLRFGSHGSMAIDLEKGTFYDHEIGKGGGVLDLITRETGRMNGAAFDWLRNELGIQVGDQPKHSSKPKSDRKIVSTYPYKDAAGDLVLEVVRYEPKD